MRRQAILISAAVFLYSFVAASDFELRASSTDQIAFSKLDATNSSSSGANQIAINEFDSAAELNVGGTIFRVPCKFQPKIYGFTTKYIRCWNNVDGQFPAKWIFIRAGDSKVWNAFKSANHPWMESLLHMKIRVDFNPSDSKESSEMFFRYLQFGGSEIHTTRKIEDTKFVTNSKESEARRYFVNHSPKAKTPYGHPLVYKCSYPSWKSGQPGNGTCITMYKWATNVVVSYVFNTSDVSEYLSGVERYKDIEDWEELDQLVRRFISQLQVDEK